MIVYHGSTVVVRQPDVLHSYRRLDFGKGFYPTTVREQAERWARRKADILNADHAIVNLYQMSDDTGNLIIKTFDDDLMDWIDPTYDQIAFVSQEAIDRLLIFDFSMEV